jgi:hypothetical protein
MKTGSERNGTCVRRLRNLWRNPFKPGFILASCVKGVVMKRPVQ